MLVDFLVHALSLPGYAHCVLCIELDERRSYLCSVGMHVFKINTFLNKKLYLPCDGRNLNPVGLVTRHVHFTKLYVKMFF